MPATSLRRRLTATMTSAALITVGGLTVTAASADATPPPATPGTVTAWGHNQWGQNDIPAGLAGKDVVQVSGGSYHSLALSSDGKITFWGTPFGGWADLPANLQSGRAIAISAGYYADLAITSYGTVVAWGRNIDGATTVPGSLTGKRATAVSAGTSHELVLTSDGHVTAWGNNAYGQATVPATLADKTVTAIEAGNKNSLALTSDGEVVAWGSGDNGLTTVPASLAGKTVTAIALGDAHALALTSDGKVTAWGNDYYGSTNVPVSLDGQDVTAISAGQHQSLALTADGTVTGWGSAGYRENIPPAGLTDVTSISAGYLTSLAVSGGGSSVPADFFPGPTATITGTPRIGEVLTAGTGDVAPAADSSTYRWFADGAQIPDATGTTFTPTAAQVGKAIRVEVTAVKSGFVSASDVSAPTAPVGLGVLAVTGSVTLTGDPTVGSTLTADSTVASTPDAHLAGVWLRDGRAIDGATGTSYVLTDADAGATVTYQVTASTSDYQDATVTSTGVGPVGGGTITLPDPTVTGSPTVDGTLTASLPETGLDPADAVIDYTWTRGPTLVGTGSSYTPTAADLGHALTVTATASKPYFDDATVTTATSPIRPADFTTGPTATITGTLKVGQMLSAATGHAVPEPDGYLYQWYADGAPIADADQANWTLTGEQKHAVITVEVTAVRDGYTPASNTSTATGAVATDLAPTLELDADKTALRRGRSTQLHWTSDEATALTATGAWTGIRPEAGTVRVRPTILGGTTYVLSATNDNGTTSAQVTVEVSRPAKVLRVAAPDGLRMRGTRIRVTATGLDAAEPYTIRFGCNRVTTGKATNAGRVDRLVRIPTAAHEGKATLAVIGSEADRVGTDKVRVVTAKRLGLTVAKHEIRASDRQRYTVRGLAAGEKVTVTYQGDRVSPKRAHATSKGTYTGTFDVDVYWGTKTVTVTGRFHARHGTRTFQVVRRCTIGHTCA